jgi:hypothetical protein
MKITPMMRDMGIIKNEPGSAPKYRGRDPIFELVMFAFCEGVRLGKKLGQENMPQDEL